MKGLVFMLFVGCAAERLCGVVSAEEIVSFHEANGAHPNESMVADLSPVLVCVQRGGSVSLTAIGGPMTHTEEDRPLRVWRVGKKVGRTIYVNDVLCGLMDSREQAEEVVAAMNIGANAWMELSAGLLEAQEALAKSEAEAAAAKLEAERVTGLALEFSRVLYDHHQTTISRSDAGERCPVCPDGFHERADRLLKNIDLGIGPGILAFARAAKEALEVAAAELGEAPPGDSAGAASRRSAVEQVKFCLALVERVPGLGK